MAWNQRESLLNAVQDLFQVLHEADGVCAEYVFLVFLALAMMADSAPGSTKFHVERYTVCVRNWHRNHDVSGNWLDWICDIDTSANTAALVQHLKKVERRTADCMSELTESVLPR